MPSLLVDTIRTLDAAMAANRQASRVKLMRRMRSQGIRVRVALGLSGCMVIGALAAFFLAHDREAAGIIAIMSCTSTGFAIIAGLAGRKNLIESLQKIDRVR